MANDEREAPRPAGRAFTWALPVERASGRMTLTRDQIVEAAIRLADAEGLEALSMRRLGKELGAGATSLYWHVRNKDELLDLVLDRVIGEVLDEVPRDLPWRPMFEQVAESLRRVIVRHRHLAPILGERPIVGPNALAGLEIMIGSLRAGGFAPETALLAATTITNWAIGYAVFEVRDPLGPHASEAERTEYARQFGEFLGSLPPDRYPHVLATAATAASVTSDMQFAWGLARLLDGIEAERARAGAGGR